MATTQIPYASMDICADPMQTACLISMRIMNVCVNFSSHMEELSMVIAEFRVRVGDLSDRYDTYYPTRTILEDQEICKELRELASDNSLLDKKGNDQISPFT